MWLMDSGASIAMSSGRSLLKEFLRSSKTKHGSTANGHRLGTEGCGDLLFDFEGSKHILLLKNVPYAPETYCNLVSLEEPGEDGNTLTIGQGWITMQDEDLAWLRKDKALSGRAPRVDPNQHHHDTADTNKQA